MTKEIYILGDITTESVAEISKEISDAINQGADKIIFKINSGGGSVIAAMGLYDEITNLNVTTESLIFGIAASAATYIPLACEKSRIYKSGTFMIHRCCGAVRGSLEEMESDLDYFADMEKKVIAIYAAKTGKTPEEIIAMMDATTYMNAEQALENGFVDEIVGKDSNLFNVADVEILNTIEVEENKGAIQKVFDFFKSKETLEEESMKNKLEATENKVIELTNEIESIKISNEAAISELKNIIAEYEKKEADLEKRISDEVTLRIANLGIDTELPECSNQIIEPSFNDCKSINDVWARMGII